MRTPLLKRVSCIAALLLAGALVGCDELPTAPPPAPEKPATPQPAERGARPSTQSVVDGQWTTVPISALPMRITVPESWTAQSVGGQRLFFMEGWTPHGHVGITLASRQQLSPDKVADFIATAKKRLDEKADKQLRFATRDFPDFTVLERIWFDERQPMLLRDDSGQLHETEGQPLNWSYLIFMKKVDVVDVYELEFSDLTLELYEKDREFLEKIIRSLVNEQTS
ncbi:MAG TPA: hypothetical protein PLD59_16435 [Tepidisphaeraceae bacterium]|nr:hypothetical protein [Tepidisphaeraceae bacterium]